MEMKMENTEPYPVLDESNIIESSNDIPLPPSYESPDNEEILRANRLASPYHQTPIPDHVQLVRSNDVTKTDENPVNNETIATNQDQILQEVQDIYGDSSIKQLFGGLSVDSERMTSESIEMVGTGRKADSTDNTAGPQDSESVIGEPLTNEEGPQESETVIEAPLANEEEETVLSPRENEELLSEVLSEDSFDSCAGVVVQSSPTVDDEGGTENPTSPKQDERVTTVGDGSESNPDTAQNRSASKHFWTRMLFYWIVVAISIFCYSGMHVIEEGSVGVYTRLGAVMDNPSQPGIYFMIPWITDVESVEIRPKTIMMEDTQTVTRDGIETLFTEIQIIIQIPIGKVVWLYKMFGQDFVQVLVVDRVSEHLKLFVANYTINDVYKEKFLDIVKDVEDHIVKDIERLGEGGVEILNLVIPKPSIPHSIANKYIEVKVEWTEQLVEIQKRNTETIRKETEHQIAVADSNRMKAILEIKIAENIMVMEGQRDLSSINNAIIKDAEQTRVLVELYRKEQQAEGNKALLTEAYVGLKMAESLANNTKLLFSSEEGTDGGENLNTLLLLALATDQIENTCQIDGQDRDSCIIRGLN